MVLTRFVDELDMEREGKRRVEKNTCLYLNSSSDCGFSSFPGNTSCYQFCSISSPVATTHCASPVVVMSRLNFRSLLWEMEFWTQPSLCWGQKLRRGKIFEAVKIPDLATSLYVSLFNMKGQKIWHWFPSP